MTAPSLLKRRPLIDLLREHLAATKVPMSAIEGSDLFDKNSRYVQRTLREMHRDLKLLFIAKWEVGTGLPTPHYQWKETQYQVDALTPTEERKKRRQSLHNQQKERKRRASIQAKQAKQLPTRLGVWGL